MFNGAQSFPHTDGMKKNIEFLLYFPDEKISNEQKNKLGTTFYNSDEFNLSGLGKNKVNSFEESESFKNRNKIVGTFPFEKKIYMGLLKVINHGTQLSLFILRKTLLEEILI